MKKRILVVDDLVIYREPIAQVLEESGYKVFAYENAEDAYQAVRSSVPTFDLFILDYSMPQMTGTTLLQKLKAIPRQSEVPSIMLTDSADKEVVVKAYQAGISEYMLKSDLNYGELLTKVKEMVS